MRVFSITNKAFVAYLLLHSTFSTQAETSHELTPSQAVEMALANNLSLNAARTVIQQAEARHGSAGKLDNPELTLSYSSDWVFNNEGEATLGIGFEQRFPVTKRLSLVKEIAKIEIALAETEVKNQERLTAQKVELLCNDLAYIESKISLREDLLDINKRFAEFIDSRIQSAEASPIDANQIRIELYAIEQELRRLQVDRSNTLGNLRSLLGLSSAASIQIISDFEKTSPEPIAFQFDQDNLNTHPEYLLKKQLLSIAENRTSLAMASRWEDIGIGVLLEDERSIDEPVGIGNDRFLGVSISIPLPLRKRNEGSYKASLSYKEQIRHELAATALELLNQAETLRSEAIELREQAIDYRANATELVNQNTQEMSNAYSAGLISLGDLFRSQEQSLRIQSAYLSMVHDYKQAEINWKAATAQNL